MAVETPTLQAFALTKSRRTAGGEIRFWRSPDIVVEPGQFVAVLGDHSTDIRLLLGILAGLAEPTGGVLRISGKAMGDLRRTQRARLRARKVGLLFGEPKLLPELSVLENVAFPQRYVGISHDQAEERARTLVDRLGLSSLLSKKPVDLTPMEGQLVSLARALVNRPAIILADEPTAGLSPGGAARFLERLRDVCREERVAVLLGTSEPRLASYAGRSVRLPASTPEPTPLAREEISANDLFSDLYETEISPLLRPLGPLLDFVLKPALYTAVVALVIVLLTFFGLRMAQVGRAGGSIDLGRAISHSLSESTDYLSNLLRGDLGTYEPQYSYYYWGAPQFKSVADAVGRTFSKSLVLLLLSMLLGGLFGVPLGLVAALIRHHKSSLILLVAAIVGISAPSFFLALLLQILEIQFYRRTGIALVPVGGFGWDRHIVLPALVLAARPIAQVARVSFVALAEVLDADYIRTARAKGLTTRAVLSRHALRNAGVPILAALGTSLGFSLSSLPVVETIFQWPGMGALLLTTTWRNETKLAASLTLILGVFFVIVHVTLDHFYRWIDPRLRKEKTSLRVRRSWVDMVSRSWAGLRELPDTFHSLIPRLRKQEKRLPPLPAPTGSGYVSPEEQRRRDAKITRERRRAWVQSTAGSLPFVLGAIILLALLGAVAFGQQVAPYSPNSPTPSYWENGELKTAPFAPSAKFLLGTDQQGRDILSLLLYGARRTLSLAFFAVLARILLGTVFGALSGWFPDSLLDRALTGLTQVIAAFPALLLALVLIHAFGIHQGLWVFALALCLVGWGEAAQFVRGQVMHIREQDYIEGALATGLGDVQLLTRHVLPNLVPSLVVLACLEMGGVLMILGELGFIGVFIGGGRTVATVTDSVATYFDVPEWGVMLSNTWRSFRSYPWMTFYPALAFTIAIVGFNLFGEGLRRLTERLTLTMHRIINRYTIGAALGIGALLLVAVEGTGGWVQFAPIADQFNSERAMADVRYLASPEMGGRGPDSPELERAAEYIAQQFAALDLQPAGPEVDGALSYFVSVCLDYRKLASVPVLQLRDRSGHALMPLVYRRDYAEIPDSVNDIESLQAEVVCLGMSMSSEGWPQNMDADPADLLDKVLLVTTHSLPRPLGALRLRAVLIVADNADYLTHRELAVGIRYSWLGQRTGYLFISPAVADAILRQGGYSLEEVRERQGRLQKDDGFLLHTGVDAELFMDVSDIKTAALPYVQAFVPGHDTILDNELVLLLAHYDGLGRAPEGTSYPGANKNASGVAVMLETARLLKEADFRPSRTIMYVAWAGAELGAEPDFWKMLRERPGFLEHYRISAVIDLVGVGAGTNDTLLLDRSTSGRLTEVLQDAANRCKVNASTLGTGIHGVFNSLYARPDPKIPYISITWDGSSTTAHTPEDTIENIEPDKLRDAGRVAALAVMYLAHEKEY